MSVLVCDFRSLFNWTYLISSTFLGMSNHVTEFLGHVRDLRFASHPNIPVTAEVMHTRCGWRVAVSKTACTLCSASDCRHAARRQAASPSVNGRLTRMSGQRSSLIALHISDISPPHRLPSVPPPLRRSALFAAMQSPMFRFRRSLYDRRPN